ncbi:lantibiotic dehydratase family protein [Parapedobacter tibetensis]|uniref:lantibiotic dehydratase family protein n=1 Tax=Parapedobacter tibetensis TaxID=2972951 RepID=UPI00214DE215|nr:lantibiotic dehydratase family protein [Parapedobacter tibetensis]
MTDIYKPFNRFLFRVPVLPFEFLTKTLLRPEENFVNEKRGEIEEGIYLSSPVLFGEWQKLQAGTVKEPEKESRIRSSLMKYVARMATRCTPFGTLATCSIGEIGPDTSFLLGNKLSRHTRLDTQYLYVLAELLSRRPEIRHQLRYYPNNTAYRMSDRLRYIEFSHVSEKIRHSITSVQSSKLLLDILNQAKRGATIDGLLNFLRSQSIPNADAKDFIEDIIESQILISELNVSTTGAFYFDRLLAIVGRMSLKGDGLAILDTLKSINAHLRHIDELGLGNVNKYRRVINDIEKIPLAYDESRLFQVDVFREHREAELGKHIVDELQSVLSLFAKTHQHQGNVLLRDFKMAFYERYEEAEVPLSIALDPDVGIGYPVSRGIADVSPAIIESLVIPRKDGRQNQALGLNALVMSKYLKEDTGRDEVLLGENDLKGIAASYQNLPSTIYVIFQVVKDRNAELLVNVKAVGGGSAKLFTRFAHLNEDINGFIAELMEKEDALLVDGNGVLAELVHLPNSRMGNILARPHIRNYEIVYLSDSDLPESNKIPVTDLMLSYKFGKLMLRSKSLNKWVYPQLTTALNYHNDTLPVYRFLCDLQNQETSGGFEFRWGDTANNVSFLPRVKFGNSILSLASWTVSRNELQDVFNLDDGDLVSKVGSWRLRRNIPQYALLSDGDNELFVDFESSLSIRSFFSTVKNRAQFILKEFIFETDSLVVSDGDGHYINECIVAFHRNKQ